MTCWKCASNAKKIMKKCQDVMEFLAGRSCMTLSWRGRLVVPKVGRARKKLELFVYSLKEILSGMLGRCM